jgi:hypothetical protein
MKNPMTAVLTVLPVAIAVLIGCSDSPGAAPSVAELAGTYHLAKTSREFLRARKSVDASPAASIRLETDGTVIVNDMPDACIDPFGRGNGGSVSGRGAWEVEAIDFGYGIRLTISAGSMPRGIISGSMIHVKGRQAPFRIEVQLGDPDNRESITFEKS